MSFVAESSSGLVGPSIACAVPRRSLQCGLGPLLQCAPPPWHRSSPRLNTARALYHNARCRLGARALHYNDSGPHYNARRRHRKHKDQQKSTKRNVNIVVPVLLQTGRSAGIPRSTIPDKCLDGFFFFHEYGRRVGMVPRSSLKEGKYNQMVRKGQRQPNNKPNKTNHSPQAETPPPSSISSVLG